MKRYNNLLEKMKTGLMSLEKGIAGLIVIPPDLENTFQAIYESKVPEKWQKSILFELFITIIIKPRIRV